MGQHQKKSSNILQVIFLLRVSQFFLSIFAFFDEKSFILKIEKTSRSNFFLYPRAVGGGTVGRAVASVSRDMRFESQHQQKNSVIFKM